MKSHQVVIIGAGPAGLSAGITLLDRGIDVLIIEKNKHPRAKLCAGALTQKTLNLIQEVFQQTLDDSIILNKIHKVEVKNKGKVVFNFECQNDFNLVNRMDFDNWLLQRYLNKGGKIIQNTTITSISNEGFLTLKDGSKISYNYLIGADGYNGISRKYVKGCKFNAALTMETDVNAQEVNVDNSIISLDFGLFKDGYTWCFPKGDKVTIGFGYTYNAPEYQKKAKCLNPKDFTKTYIKTSYCKGQQGLTCKPKGAFLPYGKGTRFISNDELNLILVGDAAGFTDAITGEGIYYAILSGNLAAKLVTNISKGDITPTHTCTLSQLYLEATKGIRANIRASWLIQRYFYLTRGFTLKLASCLTELIAYSIDNQVSYNNYNYNLLKIIFDYVKLKIFHK